MKPGKVVLAYSGGLDTSILIKYLREKYGAEIIALTADVGEKKDLDEIKARALKVGAKQAYTLDLKDEFANDYLAPAIKSNALYEGVYPLCSSLSRPLIAKKLVEVAQAEGANAVAHGCTGKGNDQVRFEVAISALAPELKTLAPIRDWGMTREEEIEYAAQHGIPVPVKKEIPYSIDVNLWGRSIECGALEDPWLEPPENVYAWTNPVKNTPDEPEYVQIDWEGGVPVKLDGKDMPLSNLIASLNSIAGKHGVGRIDHVENRLIGIKSREAYECPASTVLIEAHKAIESLTLPIELAHFKPVLESKWAELTYFGLWYSALKEAIDAFMATTQKRVSGATKVKLHKGKAVVVGRKSPNSLYDYSLATYDSNSAFDQSQAEGFIKLFGLPTKVWASVARKGG